MEWVVTPRLGLLPPGTETRYSCYTRLVGPRADLTGAENLAVTGIRSPKRPARSESLYGLSYRSLESYAAFSKGLFM